MKFLSNHQFHILKSEEENFVKNFGKKIREIRIKNMLSQEMHANIPINQVGRLERAEINTTINTVF